MHGAVTHILILLDKQSRNIDLLQSVPGMMSNLVQRIKGLKKYRTRHVAFTNSSPSSEGSAH